MTSWLALLGYFASTAWAACVNGTVVNEEYVTGAMPDRCPMDGERLLKDFSMSGTRTIGSVAWQKHYCAGATTGGQCVVHVYWGRDQAASSVGSVSPKFDASYDFGESAGVSFWEGYNSGLPAGGQGGLSAEEVRTLELLMDFKANFPAGYKVFAEATIEASDRGYHDAAAWGIYQVGLGSLTGTNGLPLDEEYALISLHAACSRKVAEACFADAFAVYYGKGGTIDKVRARSKYERACELGHMVGCERAGRMEAAGEGGPVDEALSRKHLKKACRGGREAACER